MSDAFKAFKYCGLQPHVLESIERSTLYFASPPALNDPHDCQVTLHHALQRAIEATSGQRRKLLEQVHSHHSIERMQRDVLTFGVWSYAIDLTNALLWSHYAERHSGICLTYEIPYTFVDTSNVVGISPVFYGDNPLTDWYINELDESLDVENACMQSMQRLLTIKSQAWAYEEEARILREFPGPVAVPREFLAQICFGLRTPRDFRRAVESAAKAYTNVHITEIRRDRSSDTRLVPL